jgi:hypothetical protein
LTNAFLGALEELKKSLLHQAFNGELWAPGLGFLKLAPIVELPAPPQP